MHCNELPLRKYFCIKDGGTSGPQTFTGPLGQIISSGKIVEDFRITDFEQISGENLPLIDREVLSKDAQYLYDAVNAVKSGYVAHNLDERKLSKVHNARFLTLASAILRLYMGTSEPSSELVDLARFVVKVSKNLSKNNFGIFYYFKISY